MAYRMRTMNELDRERQIDTLEYQWREMDRQRAIYGARPMEVALRDRLYEMWRQLRGDHYDPR